MPADRAAPPLADYLLLALLATLWGASYSFIKLGVATIPPVTLIAARTLIAGGILLLVLRLRGIALPTDGQTWRLFAVQALVNSTIPFVLIAWGETRIDAGLAAILNSTSPIFTFLFTWAVTRHEAVTGRKLFGVAAGVAGITLVIGLDALSGAGQQLLPQLAIVAATVCYGIAAIFGRNFKDLDPMVPAAGSMLAGAAMLIPLSLLLDRPWALAPSAASLGALAGLAVVSTALAFVIYFRLIASLGSVATMAQAYLRVPVGVAIGVVFLGETPAPTALSGLALVVIGVAAMTLPNRALAKAKPA
ncbi:DMT family transporter [Inquilinus limosus]|uniref:DMT family transporter n=1 Tax=Inquilinus limosus TaxID=171674 RepID=UPI00041F3A57|nr:EamA family transporter [Inquilinus limosus]